MPHPSPSNGIAHQWPTVGSREEHNLNTSSNGTRLQLQQFHGDKSKLGLSIQQLPFTKESGMGFQKRNSGGVLSFSRLQLTPVHVIGRNRNTQIASVVKREMLSMSSWIRHKWLHVKTQQLCCSVFHICFFFRFKQKCCILVN